LPSDMASKLEASPKVKTSGPTESRTDPSRNVRAMHTDATRRDSHLWWPVSRRCPRDPSILMQKENSSKLSTVMESPKLSPLLPTLCNCHLRVGSQSVVFPSECVRKQYSCQSLLLHHPVFRNAGQRTYPAESATQEFVDTDKSLDGAQYFKAVPATPMSQAHPRSRWAGQFSPTFTTTPVIGVPPLALETGQTNNWSGSCTPLQQTPSKTYIPSLGSLNSSVPASRTNLISPQSKKSQRTKTIKPDTEVSSFAAGRTIRDTLDLCTKVPRRIGDAPTNRTQLLGPRQLQRAIDMSTLHGLQDLDAL
jgi:hypothetical protein